MLFGFAKIPPRNKSREDLFIRASLDCEVRNKGRVPCDIDFLEVVRYIKYLVQ